MAGHSKFKNIQFRKGAQDKKRAKIFAKISKEITVAAKLGLPDPNANPRLRSAIALGKAQNMPKDNIERAIKKSYDENGENYESVRYEGFGIEGVGLIVETLNFMFLTASLLLAPLETKGIVSLPNFFRSSSLNLSRIFISCFALAAEIVLPLNGAYSLLRIAICILDRPSSMACLIDFLYLLISCLPLLLLSIDNMTSTLLLF